MILRGLASVAVIGLMALNFVLPTAKISARGEVNDSASTACS
ncbi:MAG: hypothetical protein AAF479_13970 [Pseudomonadota bacterium]